MRPGFAGTVSRPLPVGSDGVIPATVGDDVGIDAVAGRAVVDLIFKGNAGHEIVRRGERFVMVATILGEMVGVGVVLAKKEIVGLRLVALAGMRPAVIFGVRERDDVDAVQSVERI